MALMDLRLKNLFDNYGGGSASYGNQQQQAPVYTTHEPDPYEQPDSYSQIPVNDPRAPNIFAQMQSADMGGAPPKLQNDDWITRMRELDSPETAATARFDALLNNVPQRQSPGWGRTLTAIATGLGKGDVEAGQKVIDRPYDQDIAHWKEQATPAYNAANLERQANAQERTFLGNMVNQEISQRKIDAAQAKAENELAERTRSNKANEDIRMIHAKAADLRARGFKTFIDGDRIKASNPQGELIDLGPSTGMTKYDEIVLRGDQAVRAGEARDTSLLERLLIAQTMMGDRERTLKQTPAAAAPPREAPNTAKERGELEQEAFRNIKNYSPYRDFIEGDPTTGYMLLPRPEGPDGFKWDKMIKEYINPNYVGPKMDPGPLAPKPYGPGIPNDPPAASGGGYNPGGGTPQGTYNPGGGTVQGTYNPGGQYPAGGKGIAPTTPPVANPPAPNPAATSSIIYADEVKVKNMKTGVESAMSREKVNSPAFKKLVAEGIYQVVK